MGRKPKSGITIVPPTVDQIIKPETSLDRIYRENGITQRDVLAQPTYAKVFEDMGGWQLAVEYLRGSEESDAKKFMEVYDRVDPNEHDFLEYPGFCAAAGVSGKKLFGIIAAEALADSEQQINIISATKSPSVISATLDMALTPEGHRERKIVAQASGWLPRPKGTIINNGKISAGNTTNIALPAFDQDIRELGERFQDSTADAAPKMIEGKV